MKLILKKGYFQNKSAIINFAPYRIRSFTPKDVTLKYGGLGGLSMTTSEREAPPLFTV